MRKLYVVLMSAVLVALFSQISGTTTTSPVRPTQNIAEQGLVRQNMNSVPLAFTENQGQWDDRVKFRADAGGAAMWFTEDGVYYQFTRRISKDDPSPDNPAHMPLKRFSHEADSIEQLVIKASFVGANPNPAIVGESMMEYKCNYFIGNDLDEWHTDVPNYEGVTLRNIYEGVDLQFYGSRDGKLVYRYIIVPGADLDQILLAYDGLGETSFDEVGRLVAQTGWGEISGLLAAPSAKADLVSTEFSLSSANTRLSNVEKSSYAQRSPQAVELIYSTYLGGNNSDYGEGIAVDGSGAVYVTGHTESTDFPTLNPYQIHQGDYDVFVTKLSSSGNSLVYSTYLGGGAELTQALASRWTAPGQRM